MAVSNAELKVVLSAVDSMTPELKKAQAALNDLDKSAATSGKTLSGLGEGIAKLTTGAAVVGVGALAVGLGAAVKSASDFEHSISGIVAVSGAGADSIDSLRQLALQLGADTSFSANEAAQGMEELVKAGVSMADIMGGAARASLDLAAAGEVSVSEAATIASNAMNAFGISGSEMTHVADTIAGAANASAIDVHEFGFSLSSAGAVAATVGFSFDDLATAIAVMGQAGIKGSDAGTSLKTMMLNLQPQTNKQKDLFRELGLETFSLQKGLDYLAKEGIMPASDSIQDVLAAMAKSIDLAPDMSKWTKDEAEAFDKLQRKTGMLGSAFFDANGKVKSMAEVAGVLQNAMKDMTEQQRLATLETIFGSDAIRAGAVLAKAGAEGFNEMAAAMGKVSAQDVANERLNNLQGSLEKLKGSLETAAIVLGSAFLPVLKDLTDAATQAVNEGLPQMQEAVQGIADGFTVAMPVMREFFTILVENGDTIKVVAGALAAFAIIVTVTGWITGAIAAFSALGATIAASSGIIAGIVAILGGPVTIVVALIVAAVLALSVAWATNFLGIRDITASVIAFISGLFTNLALTLTTINAAMVTWLNTTNIAITTWLNTVGALWTLTWTNIQLFMQTFFDLVGQIIIIGLGLWYVLFVEPFVNIATLFIETWTAIATWLQTNFWDPVIAMFTTMLAQLMNGVIVPAWQAISQATITAWTAVLQWLDTTFWRPLVALVTTATATVGQVMQTAWNAISSLTQTAWSGIVGFLVSMFNSIPSSASRAMGPVPGIFDGAWNAVKSGISGTLGGAVSLAKGLFNQITEAAKSASKALQSFIDKVKKAGEAIPKILKPGSPPPLAVGFDFITDAIGRATEAASGFGSAMGGLGGAAPSGAMPVPSGDLVNYARQAAARWGVPADMFVRQINQESGFNPSAGSPAGALGIAQFVPGTAASYGVNPWDPYSSLEGAAHHMADLYAQFGRWDLALAAYNAGSGAVQKYGGVPPYAETQQYVRTILGYAKGGLVSGLLGAPQLAMVHGGEMVLTPGQQAALLHGSAGGGGQIVINVNAPVYGVNDMENVVISALDRAQRRGRT